MKIVKRIAQLSTIEEARAFVTFLASEIARHQRDIDQAWSDIEGVCRVWGIARPEIEELWVDIEP